MKTGYMTKLIKGLVLLGLTSFMWACGSSQDAWLPAPYVANEALIDSAQILSEINLQFSPPTGWSEADSATLNQFSEMLLGTALSTEFYPIAPQVVFRDSATGVMAYVALIQKSTGDFDQLEEKYTDFIVKHQGNAGLSQKRYKLNDLKITQFIMHTPKVVNYKILGEVDPDHRFLIEFIIGGNLFGDMEPSVSASLAALKRTDLSQDK